MFFLWLVVIFTLIKTFKTGLVTNNSIFLGVACLSALLSWPLLYNNIKLYKVGYFVNFGVEIRSDTWGNRRIIGYEFPYQSISLLLHNRAKP